MEAICRTVAADLDLRPDRVAGAAALLSDGATVPFIARYRKEATGGLDEVEIAAVRDGIVRVRRLEQRKATVLAALETGGHLTPALERQIRDARTESVLEDLYLPYRPRRRTRASAARERGLAPLADLLLGQGKEDPHRAATAYISPDAGVATAEDALAGARDIIAGSVAEDPDTRAAVRTLFMREGVLNTAVVRGKEETGATYQEYFQHAETARSVPAHRLHAMLRGSREGVLSLHCTPPPDRALALLNRRHRNGAGAMSAEVARAVADGYQRLLAPAIERECLRLLKERADREAVRVFAENLRSLLLTPPLGQKTVLAVDPGYRTGCKVVCLDPQGGLLETATVHPLPPQRREDEARQVLTDLCRRHQVEVIAVGDGTGGREAAAFLRGVAFGRAVPVISISECGASVYSASAIARRELPDQDITVRGAVSIGRRVQDPLAEYVKIEPRSLGVGQYQHDVDQSLLKSALDDAVVAAVNRVGVNVNTAGPSLLSYVSGIGTGLAERIVAHREEHGAFGSRFGLMEVRGFGPRTFEQAAGFLRVRGGENPLDATAIHPERYGIVERMAADLDRPLRSLIGDPTLPDAIDLTRYVTPDLGLPTLQDIRSELKRPGLDPRGTYEPPEFDAAVHSIDDLEAGMVLAGVVTNVTAFGAFVDLGVHVNGLVHVSELSERYVRDPLEIVRVHQRVRVTVLSVDAGRKRIALSMRGQERGGGRDGTC
ncbi:RNA-binding transcriptional accessory protein [Methanofollis fontis]|uniref:RNA-binding transcriptional accessory protein n=2 Tax=Methanofollis fontis TaxID=2052832 RepID=A0A483CXZ4_9EURY|nr:RNA-binding transcriptional accessory protein [Methanofollis fontis]